MDVEKLLVLCISRFVDVANSSRDTDTKFRLWTDKYGKGRFSVTYFGQSWEQIIGIVLANILKALSNTSSKNNLQQTHHSRSLRFFTSNVFADNNNLTRPDTS